MKIRQHLEKRECYACDSAWVPQCYGCHVLADYTKSSFDWVAGERTAGEFRETRGYLRWETPPLGINEEGKVSPFQPGCQMLMTYIDEQGHTVYHNGNYITAAGLSEISMNPVVPHTVRKVTWHRTDCHANTKAMGLGSGLYAPRRKDLPIHFEWERMVDEEGNQIQNTGAEGSRPFNKEELDRIKGALKEYRPVRYAECGALVLLSLVVVGGAMRCIGAGPGGPSITGRSSLMSDERVWRGSPCRWGGARRRRTVG